MLQTFEAVLKPNGYLQFTEAVPAPIAESCRVLVTFTSLPLSTDTVLCGAALSEAAMAKDWSCDEEDAAWTHLQAGK